MNNIEKSINRVLTMKRSKSFICRDTISRKIFIIIQGYAIAYNKKYSDKHKNDDVTEIDITTMLRKFHIIFDGSYHEIETSFFIDRDNDAYNVPALEYNVKSVKKRNRARRVSYVDGYYKNVETDPLLMEMLYDPEQTGNTCNAELLLDAIRCITDDKLVHLQIPISNSYPFYVEDDNFCNFCVVLPFKKVVAPAND